MRSFSVHRLRTAVLCAVCVQLVAMGSALAGPSSSANPETTEATKPGATATAPPTTVSTSSTPWYNRPAVREVLSRFSPSLSFYFERSIADSDSSDFGQSLGFIGGLDYAITDKLIASTNLYLYRVLDDASYRGERSDRFVLSNWFFGLTRTIKLPHVGTLLPQVFFRLPTNPDDRNYLSYRGSIGVDAELRKSNFYDFHKDHAIGGSIGFTTERNIYEYTASENGWPNRLWRVAGYVSLSYKFRHWLVAIAQFKNNWYWYPEGNRASDLYQFSTGINVSPIRQVWLALSLYSTSRTFLYDQTTLNVAFYSPEDTSVIFTMTYLPRISKTHELNR